jgi:hypothetical protein
LKPNFMRPPEFLNEVNHGWRESQLPLAGFTQKFET